MTIRSITLLKRRPGMSKAAFRDYYETHHRLIGEKVLGGFATRYVRHFLTPVDGADGDYDPDAILEIEFPNEAAMQACFAAMAEPALQAEIAADEEKLFDRSRIRTFSVSESASDLPVPLTIGRFAP